MFLWESTCEKLYNKIILYSFFYSFYSQLPQTAFADIFHSFHRQVPQTTSTDRFYRQFPQTASTNSFYKQLSQAASTDRFYSNFHRQLPYTVSTDSFHTQFPQTDSLHSFHRQLPQTASTHLLKCHLLRIYSLIRICRDLWIHTSFQIITKFCICCLVIGQNMFIYLRF